MWSVLSSPSAAVPSCPFPNSASGQGPQTPGYLSRGMDPPSDLFFFLPIPWSVHSAVSLCNPPDLELSTSLLSGSAVLCTCHHRRPGCCQEKVRARIMTLGTDSQQQQNYWELYYRQQIPKKKIFISFLKCGNFVQEKNSKEFFQNYFKVHINFYLSQLHYLIQGERGATWLFMGSQVSSHLTVWCLTK